MTNMTLERSSLQMDGILNTQNAYLKILQGLCDCGIDAVTICKVHPDSPSPSSVNIL